MNLLVKQKSKKELKVEQARQDRLNYINLNWWKDYNDLYLNNYIMKAFENNQDLKIATLKGLLCLKARILKMTQN